METITKHTPGPWNDTGLQSELDDDRDIQIGSDSGNIATVLYCGAAYNSGAGDVARFATRDANASLIAAAPELLEVLRALVNSPNAKQNEMWDAARAVIAKATGAT